MTTWFNEMDFVCASSDRLRGLIESLGGEELKQSLLRLLDDGVSNNQFCFVLAAAEAAIQEKFSKKPDLDEAAITHQAPLEYVGDATESSQARGVIFFATQGGALYCTGLSVGLTCIEGHVVNGNWHLVFERQPAGSATGTIRALDAGNLVKNTRHGVKISKIVWIPDYVVATGKDDYTSVIYWAEEKAKKAAEEVDPIPF